MGFEHMIFELRAIEPCDIEVKDGGMNCKLIIHGDSTHIPELRNIDFVADWAKDNGLSLAIYVWEGDLVVEIIGIHREWVD